jgi:GTP diphosphokinase / guanosine-3',5'-bis(diphosphate) 3'-diphosphatase
MDLIAERGIAAHWAYKTATSAATSSAQARAQDWIRGLVSTQQVAGSSLEFVENVKVDLFPDEVYLFSPRGDILALPKNATALDFAYTVHTRVGDHAVMARVDKKMVPLRTRLQSGQTVEIITAPSAVPNPQWLEFVVTSKARTAIRSHLKKLEHEDAVSLGHRMLDRVLESWVAQALLEHGEGGRGRKRHAPKERIHISGHERGVLSFATCCHPIPGDDIMGYLSAGKGIVVHRQTCPNVEGYARTPDRCIPMDWDRQVTGDFRVALRIEVDNKPGVLAQVAAAIAEADCNIDSVEYGDRDANLTVMVFGIAVSHAEHLAEVMRRVRRLGVVHEIRRL